MKGQNFTLCIIVIAAVIQAISLPRPAWGLILKSVYILLVPLNYLSTRPIPPIL